jgi:glutaredoxin/glutathione-dependent peroxiredoxin
VPITSNDLFLNKKVVLFGLPGAYTPTCSARHLPGFVEDYEKIRSLGVDSIICLSVNDPYVMFSWGKEHKADDKVFMLSDGDASFTNKLGLNVDTQQFGGVRCQRFLAHIKDGKITHLAIDEPKKFEVSSSEASIEFIPSTLIE